MMRVETKSMGSLLVWPVLTDSHARSNTGQNPPGISVRLPVVSQPTARVLALLELLQSGGIRTVAELADRLGVDERTVRRYVDHLVDLDAPVESVRGSHGGGRRAPARPGRGPAVATPGTAAAPRRA